MQTVPLWLFEQALEALAGIEELAASAEHRANEAERIGEAAGITAGSLMIAGIRAKAAREVLANAGGVSVSGPSVV